MSKFENDPFALNEKVLSSISLNENHIVAGYLLRIPLDKVFSDGHVPPLKYKVLGPKGQPQGEIAVALSFS